MRISIIPVVLALLAGCSATVDDNQNVGAQFDIYKIEVTSTENIPYSSKWRDITQAKIINFRACIKDKALLEEIPGLKFEITGNNLQQFDTTDSIGCLHWSEKFPFDSLQQEKYYTVEKTFRGPKHYPGEQTLLLAINPWLDDAAILKDLRYQKIINQNKNAAEQTKNLIIPNATLTFTGETHKKDSMSIQLQIQLTPEIKRIDIDGQVLQDPLSSGVFEAEIDLLEKQNKTDAVNSLAHAKIEATIKNGVLSFTTPLLIKQIPNPTSTLELGLNLKPLDSPCALTNEEGIFPITSLSGSKKANLIHLEQSLQNYKTLKSFETNAQNNFGFVIDQIAVEKGSFYYPTYDDDPLRSLQIKYTACLKNAFTKEKIVEHQFFSSLIPFGESATLRQKPIQLLLNGCFSHTGVIEFHQYDTEQWIPFEIVVSSNENPYKNLTQTRKIYINPWGNNDTFAFDSKMGKPPVNPNRKKPEIFISEVGYRFRKNTNDGYKLDKYLQLQLTKEFEIILEPKVKQFHSFAGDVTYSPINSGGFDLEVYLLSRTNGKVDYENLNINDYSLMAKTKISADVINGRLSAHAKFLMSFIDLPQLLARNLLVIKISPNNPGSRLFPTIVSVPFDFKDQTFSVISKGFSNTSELPWTKEQNIQSINTLVDQLDALKRRDDLITPDISPLTLFRQRVNASNKISRDDPDLILNTQAQEEIKDQYQLDLNKNWIDDVISHADEKITSQLCALFYQKKKKKFFETLFNPSNISDYQRCKNNPLNAINVSSTTHIDKIIEGPFKEAAYPGIMIRSHTNSVGISFSSDKTQGERFAMGLNASLGLNILGKFGFNGLKAGASASYDLYWSKSTNESISDGTSITESRSAYLFYNNLTLSFTANTTKCVLISAKKMKYIITYPTFALGSFGGASIPAMETRYLDSPEVFHICQDKPQTQTLTEDWYFVGEYWRGQSVLADGMEIMENPLTQLIRGKKTFEDYRHQLNATNTELILKEANPELVTKRYQMLYDNGETEMPKRLFLDNAFPGFIQQ